MLFMVKVCITVYGMRGGQKYPHHFVCDVCKREGVSSKMERNSAHECTCTEYMTSLAHYLPCCWNIY